MLPFIISTRYLSWTKTWHFQMHQPSTEAFKYLKGSWWEMLTKGIVKDEWVWQWNGGCRMFLSTSSLCFSICKSYWVNIILGKQNTSSTKGNCMSWSHVAQKLTVGERSQQELALSHGRTWFAGQPNSLELASTFLALFCWVSQQFGCCWISLRVANYQEHKKLLVTFAVLL